VILPFSTVESISIPTTFSPTVTIAPARAAPMAKPSQLTQTTSVLPKAPVSMGTFSGVSATLVDTPTFLDSAMF
jgi:hypothetical protein